MPIYFTHLYAVAGPAPYGGVDFFNGGRGDGKSLKVFTVEVYVSFGPIYIKKWF